MPAPDELTGNKRARAASQQGRTQREDLGLGHLYGHLTRDPELRYTPSGRAVAALRVAYTPRVQDHHGGPWRDGETEYYDVTAFGRQAENIAECLAKGDRVVAAGRWQRETWTDGNGEQRQKVALIAADFGASLLFGQVRVYRRRRDGQPAATESTAPADASWEGMETAEPPAADEPPF